MSQPPTDPKFGSFLAKLKAGSPAVMPDTEPANPEDEYQEDDYEGYTSLVESDYNDIHVAVNPPTLTAHQALVDYEIKRAPSTAEKEYWCARRAPKMQNSTPHLSLSDALEAFDYQWAERNNLLDAVDYNGSMCSPEADRFYTISNQLFEHVWNGLDAEHLLKQLQESLYSPTAERNILIGAHNAREVAETILDLAHAYRTELKGPNRGI